MKSRRRLQGVFIALLFILTSVGAVFAGGQDDAQNGAPPPPPNAQVQQDYPDQGAQPQNYPNQGAPSQGAQQSDPSGRVARVQYMSGEVSIQPGGVNDWIAASTNRPLTTSDRVWTDKNSKAELNVGDGFLRMNSETSVTLTNVSDGTVQIELDQGTLSVTVRHLEKGEIYEVDTPNYAFTVMKSGTYRFDVYPNEDQSWVTVRSGYGEATGKGTAVRVNSGMQVRFKSGNSLIHTAENAPSRDGFDDWVQVRDKRLDDSLSARYVSPGVIGYQDLDAYGSWTTTPNYGPVWTPNSVPAGWAPYRYGQWVWIAPWGWTWVDSAPWGFAPFHYGRWVNWNGGWGWAPGPTGYWNPYYSPALVGWVGGPGFGIGFGFGGGGWGIGVGFGWFPLGWGQPYYPRYCGWGYGGWYRGGGYVSGNYFRNVNVTNTNITNITNVTNNYFNNNVNGIRNTNPVVRNGVTSASRQAFTSGAAVNRVGGAVPASALNNTRLLNTAGVSPTRSSVLGGQAPRTSGVPANTAANRQVVTRATPPSTRPVGFGGNESAARGNTNTLAHGAPNTAAGAPNNATHTGLGAAQNTQAARGAGATQTEARANVPENPTHNVPRPPSAGEAANTPHSNVASGAEAGTPSHNVPRPPTANDSFARPNGSAGNYANNRAPAAGSNQRYGGETSTVPRPPQSYQPNRTGSSTPQYSAPHQSTPQYSAPQSNTRGNSHGGSSSGPGAASAAPRPPAGYSYRQAPTYSAGSGAGRPSSGNYGGSPRSYSAPSYNSRRSPYGAAPSYSGRSYGSTPTYSARSYGATPSYSGRSYGSAPSYSSRSMGPYSAPHSSGGSSYHGGGGGGSHSSGGSGGHHGR